MTRDRMPRIHLSWRGAVLVIASFACAIVALVAIVVSFRGDSGAALVALLAAGAATAAGNGAHWAFRDARRAGSEVTIARASAPSAHRYPGRAPEIAAQRSRRANEQGVGAWT